MSVPSIAAQRMLIWTGPALMVIFFVGFWVLGDFIPPPSPGRSPQQVVEFFRTDTDLKLLGSLSGVAIGTHAITHVPAGALRVVLGCVLVASALGIARKAGAEITPAAIVGVPLDGGLAKPSGSSGPLRYRITFADGEILHVRMTRVHAVAKLLMRGEDDAESRLNDYEAFGDLEIEETGEQGFGVLEHSTLPPTPSWPTSVRRHS